MPTVLREDGFEVRVNLREHAPPHVHVLKGGAEVLIYLDPADVEKQSAMSRADLARALTIVWRSS